MSRKLRFILGILVAIAVAVGLALAAPSFIHTDAYRAQILAAIKQRTGHEATIRGGVSLSLLPLPSLDIAGLELSDTNEMPGPLLTVDLLRLRPTISSLFSGPLKIDGIILDHPTLQIARARDDQIHWDWLNAGLLKAATGPGGAWLRASAGKIIYRGHAGHGVDLDDFALSVSSGARTEFGGGFTVSGHSLKFSGHADGANFDVTLSSGDDTLHGQGALDLSSDVPRIKGQVALDVKDVFAWTQKSPAQPAASLMPLKLTAEWTQDGANANFSKLEWQGMNSTGSGDLALSWDGSKPEFTSNFAFSQFDYDAWQPLAAELSDSPIASQSFVAGAPPNPIPTDIAAGAQLSADTLTFDGRKFKNAKLSASMGEGVITINQFSAALPGDSTLTLFGVISQGETAGLRFEGGMETQGKSLRQALTTAMDESESDLPESGLNDFSVKANMFISSEQMRLSEADAKFGDLHLNGGLVAYFDAANPRLEADARLKDINFDYFRDAWRDAHKGGDPHDFFLKFDRAANFGWLKKLRTNVDLRVSVEGFTLLERKGDNATFRIFAKQNEFGIYNMRFVYPSDALEGSFNLDVKGDRPLVNLVVNASEIDTNYFRNPAAALKPVAQDDKKIWSEELLDMSWMNGFDGVFDISVGKLDYNNVSFGGVKLLAKLGDDLLTFKNLNFDYWNGRISVLGSVYGGSVPGFSLSFTLYDADLQSMLKDIAKRENVSGKVSVSGTLTSSGVNMSSWINQLESKLTIAARGVVATGLNLPGVVSAVEASRSAVDVANNVGLQLTNGSTEMTVDGVINVKSGILRTAGITLRSGAIIGDLVGEVRLPVWTMDLSTLFQFPAMTSETIPTMTVRLSGPIETPEMKSDTSSLEAYVAKRIISK